jgi:hypothetical protein
MTKDEALAFDLALKALGLYQAAGFGNSTDFNKQHEAFYKAQTAITAIKQALAAPVQERCKYCDGTGDVHDQTGEWRGTCHCVKAAQPAPVQPVGTVKDLFTQAAWEKLDVRGSTNVYLTTPPAAQRQWVGLTQDEFRDFASTLEYGTGGLIRAIEAKLKEKNT